MTQEDSVRLSHSLILNTKDNFINVTIDNKIGDFGGF